MDLKAKLDALQASRGASRGKSRGASRRSRGNQKRRVGLTTADRMRERLPDRSAPRPFAYLHGGHHGGGDDSMKFQLEEEERPHSAQYLHC
eukprot:scaffold6895_cov309-Ochromonas_danica.AAC.1